MWAQIKKYFSKNVVAEATAEKVAQKVDPLIGEPVVSFINSFKENPKRFRFKAVKHPASYPHKWMTSSNTVLVNMYDKKTGNVFTAVMYEDKLYDVLGLGFSLNHWEKSEIFYVVDNYRYAIAKRRYDMIASRNRRDREKREVVEKAARAELAKQFQ